MRNPTTVAVLLGLVGAVVATVLGFLTFGAQATAAPDHVPLAVAAPADGPLRQAADQLALHGGAAVRWRVTDPATARQLLSDKEVYGVLALDAMPGRVTVLLSGAVDRRAPRSRSRCWPERRRGWPARWGSGPTSRPRPSTPPAPPVVPPRSPRARELVSSGS
jgi:hypothetical protein